MPSKGTCPFRSQNLVVGCRNRWSCGLKGPAAKDAAAPPAAPCSRHPELFKAIGAVIFSLEQNSICMMQSITADLCPIADLQIGAGSGGCIGSTNSAGLAPPGAVQGHGGGRGAGLHCAAFDHLAARPETATGTNSQTTPCWHGARIAPHLPSSCSRMGYGDGGGHGPRRSLMTKCRLLCRSQLNMSCCFATTAGPRIRAPCCFEGCSCNCWRQRRRQQGFHSRAERCDTRGRQHAGRQHAAVQPRHRRYRGRRRAASLANRCAGSRIRACHKPGTSSHKVCAATMPSTAWSQGIQPFQPDDGSTPPCVLQKRKCLSDDSVYGRC